MRSSPCVTPESKQDCIGSHRLCESLLGVGSRSFERKSDTFFTETRVGYRRTAGRSNLCRDLRDPLWRSSASSTVGRMGLARVRFCAILPHTDPSGVGLCGASSGEFPRSEVGRFIPCRIQRLRASPFRAETHKPPRTSPPASPESSAASLWSRTEWRREETGLDPINSARQASSLTVPCRFACKVLIEWNVQNMERAN